MGGIDLRFRENMSMTKDRCYRKSIASRQCWRSWYRRGGVAAFFFLPLVAQAHPLNISIGEEGWRVRKLEVHTYLHAVVGDWGECNAACIRSRVVMCSTREGRLVANDICGDELPPMEESCHDGKCVAGGKGSEKSGHSDSATESRVDLLPVSKAVDLDSAGEGPSAQQQSRNGAKGKRTSERTNKESSIEGVDPGEKGGDLRKEVSSQRSKNGDKKNVVGWGESHQWPSKLETADPDSGSNEGEKGRSEGKGISGGGGDSGTKEEVGGQGVRGKNTITKSTWGEGKSVDETLNKELLRWPHGKRGSSKAETGEVTDHPSVGYGVDSNSASPTTLAAHTNGVMGGSRGVEGGGGRLESIGNKVQGTTGYANSHSWTVLAVGLTAVGSFLGVLVLAIRQYHKEQMVTSKVFEAALNNPEEPKPSSNGYDGLVGGGGGYDDRDGGYSYGIVNPFCNNDVNGSASSSSSSVSKKSCRVREYNSVEMSVFKL
ncbi:unnamed protein product [Choristocarpus tenellus]